MLISMDKYICKTVMSIAETENVVLDRLYLTIINTLSHINKINNFYFHISNS